MKKEYLLIISFAVIIGYFGIQIAEIMESYNKNIPSGMLGFAVGYLIFLPYISKNSILRAPWSNEFRITIAIIVRYFFFALFWSMVIYWALSSFGSMIISLF